MKKTLDIKKLVLLNMPYFVCEKDPEGFERFEATFPAKEKQKLPGQLF